MVRRPESLSATRRAMREALQKLESKGKRTPCAGRPIPYTDVRQTPTEAAKLCGKNLPEGSPGRCPLLELCGQLGFTESVHADDMVYGGYTWRRGLPLVSETAFAARRGRGELPKLPKTGT